MGEITAIDTFFDQLGKAKQRPQDVQLELVELAQQGDIEARDILVTSNLRLVVKVAKKYCRNNVHDMLDLIQVGTLGLMHAVKKFDSEFGVQFTTYAITWIRAEITLYIKKNKKFLTQVKLQDFDRSVDILETMDNNLDIDKVFEWTKDFMSTLSERDSIIFEDRVLNCSIVKLQDLGDRFKITRERVRQIEDKLRERYYKYVRNKADE